MLVVNAWMGLVLVIVLLGRVWSEILIPPYFNLAKGRKIYASATCGEDTEEPEAYCKLVEASEVNNKDFNLTQGQSCDVCDPSRPDKRHLPEFTVDGKETWWQSPPLSRGMKYNEVNLTIDLEQEFHVAYVFIRMGNSPRPDLWILEKSKDYGKTYSPWQYFSDSPADCELHFGKQSLQPITKDDDVICSTEYSKVFPLDGGEIFISLLNNRPSANQYFNSTVLQEWMRATNIRFRFLRIKKLPGHLTSFAEQDPTVTKKYFYSIKDISVEGRCICNGHADVCDNLDPSNPTVLLCRCQHNTCGPKCEMCCPGHEQKAWGISKTYDSISCELCNCFQHSNICIYDPEIDKQRLSLDIYSNYEGGGVCQNCQHNTEGINCNKCKVTFFRPYNKSWNESDACQPCNCDATFSTGNCSEGSGLCECRKEFAPPDCSSCSIGYYDYPTCKPCECFPNGTVNLQCNATNGQCPCKPNFRGIFCKESAPGYYNFPNCIHCNCDLQRSLSSTCDQHSGSCTCKSNYGGKYCDECLSGYFNYPNCSKCSCDVKRMKKGVCEKESGKCLCKEGFSGELCDQCIPGYYGYPDCQPCNCNQIGSISQVCESSGKCQCLSNFTGHACNQCRHTYYKFPECLPCNCNIDGSITLACDIGGYCECHLNFEGQRCDKCKEGFNNFPLCKDIPDCEYKYQPTETGGICFCPSDKELAPDKRTCVNKNWCKEWGYCDQLCTNTDGGSICSCAPGYTLKQKNRCIAENASDLTLFFAYAEAVCMMNSRGEDVEVLANTTEASGLDFHYQKDLLFWSDIKTKRIYVDSLKNSGSFSPSIYDFDEASSDSWLPVAIAVDWIGDKLYVADSLGHKIDVFELTGKYRTIILATNLTNPSDIALDPLEGYMFIVDILQVLRANKDGTNVRLLASKFVDGASGIAVDLIAKRVYWCDNHEGYIKTINYEGQNRLFVVREQYVTIRPSRLALFEDRIFWTDDIKPAIMSANKFESLMNFKSIYHRTDIRNPRAIKTVHKLSQPVISNPCENNNAGCQHMCIVTKMSSGLGYRCACNIGFQLSSNERTCDLVNNFLLYSQWSIIKGKILDPIVKSFNDAILPVISRGTRFVGLDFDAKDEYIYYSDNDAKDEYMYYSDIVRNVIYRMHRNGSAKEVLLASERERVDGFALDWISKNLYYIDSKKGTLSVLSTRNITHRKTLRKYLRDLKAIVVHPNKGYIYFSQFSPVSGITRFSDISELEPPARISRAYSDGTNLIVFKNLSLGWPKGLAIDLATDRLYWCDALLDHVQHSNLDGTDVTTINSKLINHPFSIAIYQDYIYLSDWQTNAIFKLHKLKGDNAEVVVRDSAYNRFYGVKVYSSNEQRMDVLHSCLHKNGGCEKLCFAVPRNDSHGLTARCDCPDVERLTSDEKSCEPDSSHELFVQACQSWQFTCNNQKCISKSWLCDGENDCLDNSDELNCTAPTCKSNEFQCKSGSCIPKAFWCDFDNDCNDSSDEKNCNYTATCSSNQFQCNNGRCVPSAWKCDSENDCGDGSDEGDSCVKKTCSEDYFTCSESGRCIPRIWVCDGEFDCSDKEDEKYCSFNSSA